MFQKIIVGLDGSKASEQALHIACDLAGKYSSEIHLVHTPQPQTVAFAMGAVAGYHAATTMPSEGEVKEAGEKILNSGKAILAEHSLKASHELLGHGDPADAITDYAKTSGADLIVTGRRGLGAVGTFVLGSTSQRINHTAECACLSVV